MRDVAVSGGAFTCTVCGSNAEGSATLTSDYVTGEPFRVVECSECGVAATLPRPTDLARYYLPSYRHYTGLSKFVLRGLLQRRVQRWCQARGRPGKALELGSGEGWMLSALSRQGWTAIGTERDLATARGASQSSGCPVLVGEIDSVTRSGTFDAIILFQVLEHLPDPVHVLSECAARLGDGGKVLVGVPNTSSWQANLFRGKWFHYDTPRHLHHFSVTSLGAAAERAGLKIAAVSYSSLEHDPFGWIQSFLNLRTTVPNRLTRNLMGERIGSLLERRSDALTAMLLAPFAIVLSVISWIFRSGAILQAELVHDADR